MKSLPSSILPVLWTAALLAGCSGGSASPSGSETVRDDLVPDTATMMEWISDVVAQGIRRPGYAADAWTEEWARDRFVEMGLEEVTLDPVPVLRWESQTCAFEVWTDDAPDERLELPCFPLPFTAGTDGLEAEIAFAADADADDGGATSSRIAIVETLPLLLPQTFLQSFSTWAYDPRGEIPTHVQTILFAPPVRAQLEAQIEAGAAALVSILRAPWETDRLYVPYDAESRPIPAVWLSPANGDRMLGFLRGRPARGRLRVDRTLDDATSHNVTGVLRGASDEWVVIGSHHDGPWASAVEDASGVALVLAQARYWSRVPESERPHNLLFLLNAGHMAGSAGLKHFTSTRRDFIANDVVLELHLEHVAREAAVEDGRIVPTAEPEWRWWFTSRIPPLEEAVADAICREDVGRSFVMPAEGFPPGNVRPPTDGGRFHPLAPIVNLLAAPMYLFDASDTIEMIHEESLVPLTRAAVRIVASTRSQTAASLRAETYAPPRETLIAPCEGAS
jgi:hypothetical protein